MISQKNLVYRIDAYGDILSESSLVIHYLLHHAAYVKKANALAKKHGMKSLSVEEIIRACYQKPELQALYNNAGQCYNHNFFWHSIYPENYVPNKRIMDLVIRDFGSFRNCLLALYDAGANFFGSGWLWLVWEDEKLKVVTTQNADSPITNPKQTPLMCIDLWEHSYYLDYKQKRLTYIRNMVQYINWDFVEKNYKLMLRAERKKNKEG